MDTPSDPDVSSPDVSSEADPLRSDITPSGGTLDFDQHAELEATYREHARELWARFYTMCSDPERASDAVQEAFVRLAGYLDGVKAEPPVQGTPGEPTPDESTADAGSTNTQTPDPSAADSTPTTEPIRDLKAWLIRVGQNWLRDVARRKDQGNRQVEVLDRFPHRQQNPLAEMIGDERQDLIRQLLARMRPDDREVLVLRYALAWSSKRMADTLETSPSAIDMRLSRARRRFADMLEEAGLTDDTF